MENKINIWDSYSYFRNSTDWFFLPISYLIYFSFEMSFLWNSSHCSFSRLFYFTKKIVDWIGSCYFVVLAIYFFLGLFMIIKRYLCISFVFFIQLKNRTKGKTSRLNKISKYKNYVKRRSHEERNKWKDHAC